MIKDKTMQNQYRLGIDAGGTFTDFVALDKCLGVRFLSRIDFIKSFRLFISIHFIFDQSIKFIVSVRIDIKPIYFNFK